MNNNKIIIIPFFVSSHPREMKVFDSNIFALFTFDVIFMFSSVCTSHTRYNMYTCRI